MRIEHLREFVELAYSPSFTKAAARLNIAQSALSKHIAQLEQECHATLVERGCPRIALTDAGKVLFEETIAFLENHDRILGRVRAAGASDTVRVGGMNYNPAVTALVAEAAAKLGSRDTARFVEPTVPSMRAALEEGDVDVAVLILRDESSVPEGCDVRFLWCDPLMALMADDGSAAGRPPIGFAELATRTLIRPTGSSSIQGNEAVMDMFDRAGVNPRSRTVFLNSLADFRLIELGDDVFLLEKSFVDHVQMGPGYVAVPVDDPTAALRVYAAVRRDADERVHRLLDAMEELAREARSASGCTDVGAAFAREAELPTS